MSNDANTSKMSSKFKPQTTNKDIQSRSRTIHCVTGSWSPHQLGRKLHSKHWPNPWLDVISRTPRTKGWRSYSATLPSVASRLLDSKTLAVIELPNRTTPCCSGDSAYGYERTYLDNQSATLRDTWIALQTLINHVTARVTAEQIHKVQIRSKAWNYYLKEYSTPKDAAIMRMNSNYVTAGVFRTDS